MKFDELMKTSVVRCKLNVSGTAAAEQYEGDDEATHALLFRREQVDFEDINEELEVWLETAEAEEADEDLVLCGYHPIDEDTQVERLFYYRKSRGGGSPVYSLDVDGTAVPGTLQEFAPSFNCFEPA